MTVKQLSVFVENKPGSLAEITAVLHRESIDIRALSIADTTSFGVLRLIVDRPAAAAEALRTAGFTVSLTKVIAVGVSDCPGGLTQVLSTLADAGITVEYMYAFISRQQDAAYVILRTDDNSRTCEVLSEKGIPILSEKDIGGCEE
ncbi:MAG: ACT domain-containing protein [Angelakisella sp.]